MSYVRARPGESIDSLLKRFKKAVEGSGILSDYRRNERYEKPSVQKKRKQSAARKRALKAKSKLERNQKPKMGNWKWNKNRTKKIVLKSYTSTSSRQGRFKSSDNRRGGYKGKSNYKGNKPRFTNSINKDKGNE